MAPGIPGRVLRPRSTPGGKGHTDPWPGLAGGFFGAGNRQGFSLSRCNAAGMLVIGPLQAPLTGQRQGAGPSEMTDANRKRSKRSVMPMPPRWRAITGNPLARQGRITPGRESAVALTSTAPSCRGVVGGKQV